MQKRLINSSIRETGLWWSLFLTRSMQQHYGCGRARCVIGECESGATRRYRGPLFHVVAVFHDERFLPTYRCGMQQLWTIKCDFMDIVISCDLSLYYHHVYEIWNMKKYCQWKITAIEISFSLRSNRSWSHWCKPYLFGRRPLERNFLAQNLVSKE